MYLNDSLEKRQNLTDPVVVQFKTQRLKIFFGRTYIFMLKENTCFGLVGRVFANDPGDLGSIPGRVIPKTLKMVLDTSLLNTQ